MDVYWALPKVQVDRLDEDEDDNRPTEAAVVIYNYQPSSSFHCELQQESQEEIGDRKKGRKKGKKKGRKNKTKKVSEESAALLRQQKNSKERSRIKSIGQKYNELRRILGFDLTKKRYCKHKILKAAIEYITKLQELLCDETIHSSESSSSSTESSPVQSCLLPPGPPHHANPGLSPVPFSYHRIGRYPSLSSPPHFQLMEFCNNNNNNGGRRKMEFPCNPGAIMPPAGSPTFPFCHVLIN